MTHVQSSLGTLFFLALAPGTVAGLIPYWMTQWQSGPLWRQHPELLLYGGLFIIGLGLVGLLESFARFALVGRGTPAPVAPTERLVVSGFYRWVRNPMYLSVLALIIGQGVLLGQTVLIVYGVTLWCVFHLFVISYEEPTLRKTFSSDYAHYTAQVRRWLPRLRPWTPD